VTFESSAEARLVTREVGFETGLAAALDAGFGAEIAMVWDSSRRLERLVAIAGVVVVSGSGSGSWGPTGKKEKKTTLINDLWRPT
jgi:hypothetical protein